MTGPERLRALKTLAPAIANVDGFALRPMRTAPVDDEEVRLITEWRNRYVHSFLHEFEATVERTSGWLSSRVGPDDTRILFSFVDETGRMVGYLGLAYIEWDRLYGEADAIVRGEPLPRGIMKRALLELLAWARRELGLATLGVRVLSDNPACAFYERCGFVEQSRQALAARTTDDGVIWEPTAGTGTRELVHYLHARD